MELKESQSGETSRTVLQTTGYWVDTNLGRHLDLNIGNSAYTWGYQDPELITALTNAMQVSFVRGRQGESCELLDRVNDQLCALAGMDTVLWTVSGSDAVEAALEIAYQWHKKTDNRLKILNFAPGYHGTTWLAKAMRTERNWSEYIVVADAPTWNTNNQQLVEEDKAWTNLINTLDNDHNIGTIIIESLPWITGVRDWSTNWWKNLRNLCTERGILLCLDDVAGGFGKVSAGISHTAFGIDPDIIALGKAVTGGHVPLSCALAHKKLTPVLESIDWFHGHTWQPYVPGLAVVEKIIERVNQDHFDRLVAKFNQWIADLKQDSLITEARGTGLMRELLLTNPLQLGSMDCAGLVINGIPKDGLTIVVPQIADRRYWQELDTRVRNLLS